MKDDWTPKRKVDERKGGMAKATAARANVERAGPLQRGCQLRQNQEGLSLDCGCYTLGAAKSTARLQATPPIKRRWQSNARTQPVEEIEDTYFVPKSLLGQIFAKRTLPPVQRSQLPVAA